MDKKSVGEVSKILARWIAIARARTQKKEPLGEHTKSIKNTLGASSRKRYRRWDCLSMLS